jgi:hypothetical protein
MGLTPRLATVLILMLAAVYLANTFLYLTPPNPVKAQWMHVVSGLAHPLFAQNWHLFAPNPIRSNYVLSVRCRTRQQVSRWFDVTQPMLALHHRKRISPMGRLLRVHQNAMRLFLGFSSDEWRQVICRRDPRSAACRPDGPAQDRQRRIGALLLSRTAAGACEALTRPGYAQAVQMRLLIHTPPPWSRRHLPASQGTTRFIDLPWEPLPAAR